MSRAYTDEQIAEMAGLTRAPAPTPAEKLVEGYKADEGKLPWHLLAPDAVDEVLKVLDYGQRKYAPRNWEKGMAWSRCFSALMRHMWAFWKGEDNDPETGLSHLAHAGCCIMFLLAFQLRRIGTDDRPRGLIRTDKDPDT